MLSVLLSGPIHALELTSDLSVLQPVDEVILDPKEPVITTDTIAPSAPALSSSTLSSSAISLSWSSSTDNVGVVGYNIYQNGVLKSSTTGTSLVISGLAASTSYSFYVKAKDAAGNLSLSSNVRSATTLALADTIAPSAPVLAISNVTSSSVTLSWSASSDNVGVVGYNIYQNGVLRASGSGTSFVIAGLSAGTAYSFYVKAKDAAGNLSLSSNTNSVVTQAQPLGGSTSGYNTFELQAVALVNNYRAQFGLAPVTMNDYVSSKCAEHDLWMIQNNTVSHYNFANRAYAIKAATGATSVGEVIAYGYSTAQGAVNGWINSSSHQAILVGNYNRVGIAVRQHPTTLKYYYTMIFIR